MYARFLPSISFLVLMAIGAISVFVVGFAYGYEVGNP